MMSKIPFDQSKFSPEAITMQNVRVALMAELDAINLYEQLAANEPNEKVRKTLLDVIDEERRHVGEFNILLLNVDKNQADELDEASDEIGEIDD